MRFRVCFESRNVSPVSQAETEIVIGFAVIRIRVSARETLDRVPKMGFSKAELATAKMPESQGVVAPRIERIAPQGLTPVKRRTPGRVPVLFEMETDKIKFFEGGDVSWKRRFGRGKRHLAFRALLWRIGNDFAPVGVRNAQRDVGFAQSRRELDYFHKRLTGSQITITRQ